MIPQVNAGATDRNREQAEWIVKKLGYEYYPDHDLDMQFRRGDMSALAWKSVEDFIRLPNGSLTPDQVWGILERECVGWHWAGEDDANNNEGGAAFPKSGWYKEWEDDLEDALIIETNNPHDLTAAMDALIKVLETKGEKV